MDVCLGAVDVAESVDVQRVKSEIERVYVGCEWGGWCVATIVVVVDNGSGGGSRGIIVLGGVPIFAPAKRLDIRVVAALGLRSGGRVPFGSLPKERPPYILSSSSSITCTPLFPFSTSPSCIAESIQYRVSQDETDPSDGCCCSIRDRSVERTRGGITTLSSNKNQ